MQYLTYEEYTEIGGTLDLTAFKRNIDRACSIINNETKRRIENMKEIPQEAKACCRDLVEYISSSSLANKGISSQSQSAGGVSESVSYASISSEQNYSNIEDIVSDHLLSVFDDFGTPLLYRGANKNNIYVPVRNQKIKVQPLNWKDLKEGFEIDVAMRRVE